MSDETYNGWSNWETWCANLWLENDEGTYDMVRETVSDALEGRAANLTEGGQAYAAGDAIQALVESYDYDAKEGDWTMIGEPMSTWRIDWAELGEHWAVDYRESVDYESGT